MPKVVCSEDLETRQTVSPILTCKPSALIIVELILVIQPNLIVSSVFEILSLRDFST